ncbi:hypothetical protein EN943_32610 [Mesorhizobium sp. M7A.F.Ca.US.006.01.1.1]|nr:hypothetical protein EN943_32610 [Mesorhizobium sp. M7A.F.Ca.US.006.01.1.1]
MMNPEVETSQALVARLVDLQARARAARLNEAEVKTFEKVAAVTDDGLGRPAQNLAVPASMAT